MKLFWSKSSLIYKLNQKINKMLSQIGPIHLSCSPFYLTVQFLFLSFLDNQSQATKKELTFQTNTAV